MASRPLTSKNETQKEKKEKSRHLKIRKTSQRREISDEKGEEVKESHPLTKGERGFRKKLAGINWNDGEQTKKKTLSPQSGHSDGFEQ